MSGCKCPNSDVPKKTEQCPPYFEDITMKMEERRCDLVGKHKHLREKITTMERSIPALIAYNMWMAKKCNETPYSKVRQIMKTLSPYPDPTEKLLASLKSTVKQLNGETEELHEKIIQADVKLEETEMELESVELVNKEMELTVNNLEGEVRRYTTPSLHSIHSEDVLCLSKIRQLAEEELNLKHCIQDLEEKETLFKEHMSRLLTCKDYQNPCMKAKPVCCSSDLDFSGPKVSGVSKKSTSCKQGSQKQKQQVENVHIQVETNNAVATETVCKSWISSWWNCNKKSEKAPEKKGDTPTVTAQEGKKDGKESNESSSEAKPKQLQSKSAQCSRPCMDPKNLQRALKSRMSKLMPPCAIPCNIPANNSCKKSFKRCAARNLLSELPCCRIADHGIRTGCKAFSLPCELRPWKGCPMPHQDYGRAISDMRSCNCKASCFPELSEAECNCTDEPFDDQPTGSKQLADSQKEESNSDEEFCECCSCGCEDIIDDL